MTDTALKPEILTNVEDPLLHPKISNSELYTLNKCKRSHMYGYGMGLSPKTTPGYFTKGSFLHTLMADILSAVQKGEEFDVALLSIQHQTQAVKSGLPSVSEVERLELVDQLQQFWSGIEPFPVVAVEQEFYVDLGWTNPDDPDGPAPLLHGFVDAAIRDDTKDLWMVEHKTSSRAWSAQQFQTAYQGKLYSDAWGVLTGEQPVGIQYNFFYPKRYETRQLYVDPVEAQLLRDEIQANLDIRAFMYQKGVFPREPLWGCGGCPFFNVCWSEAAGADVSHIIATEFTVNEEKAARYDID